MTNLYIHLLLQVQNHSASDSASISVIRSYVERLARDGGLDLWDWLAIVIAFISLVIAWLMAVWQKRTERNTMKITKGGTDWPAGRLYPSFLYKSCGHHFRD